MIRLSAARPVTVALVVAALAVAGCSSKKAATASSSTANGTPAATTPAPGASASLPTFQGDPAAVTAVKQAIAALGAAKTVHMKGTITQGGQSANVDLQFSNGHGATGSIGYGGGTMKIIATATDIYVQADAQAFSAFAGGAVPSSALNLIAGKWLRASASEATSQDNPFSAFSDFANMQSFADQFTPSGSVSLVKGTTTINGKKAIGVLDDGGGDPSQSSILYVSDDSSHLPLRIVPGPGATAATASGGPASGEIDFVEYGQPVTITAPAGAIDISQLAALMGAGASPTG
jgi:hypothetical protein